MSQALEFTVPPSVGTAFNRNIRKFRILQADFGDGLLPLVVGTYSIDPTTGNPLAANSIGVPLFMVERDQGTAINTVQTFNTVIPPPLGKALTYFGLCITSDTTGLYEIEDCVGNPLLDFGLVLNQPFAFYFGASGSGYRSLAEAANPVQTTGKPIILSDHAAAKVTATLYYGGPS